MSGEIETKPSALDDVAIEAMVDAMVKQSTAFPVVPPGYAGKVDALHPFTARQCLLAALRTQPQLAGLLRGDPERSECLSSPTARVATYAVTDRQVLFFASYCGEDNPDCSDRLPCPVCLGMSNVYRVTGTATYDRQLAPDWLHTPPAVAL